MWALCDFSLILEEKNSLQKKPQKSHRHHQKTQNIADLKGDNNVGIR